jgi:crotonobetainyl-CoA:carnitine CoA-transferase CaiB-like acyl-CoA transferase
MPERGLADGLRVVEVGGGIAVPLVGLLLGEHGAEVVRLVEAAPPPVDPVLEAVLGRGKVVVEVAAGGTRAALDRLLARADVVLLDDAALPDLDLEAARRDHPALVTCRVSHFPPGHPAGDAPRFEAAAGMAGYLYNTVVGQPCYHDFSVASVAAGLYAAIGVAAALVARESTRRGQHVETSLVEAAVSAQVLQVLAKAGIPRAFLPLRMVGSPFMRVWECGDGRYVYLHITMPKHNAAMLEQLERHGYRAEVDEIRGLMSEQTQRDPSQVGSIAEAEQLKEIYARIFRSQPAGAWEELFGDHLCCIKIRTIAEWLDASSAAGMSDATRVDDPVFGELVTPGALLEPLDAPVRVAPRTLARLEEVAGRWQAAPPAAWGDAAPVALRHPLDGVHVVDLSRIIAGPCAARVLAELGADVVSIMSETRLDWSLSFHLVFNAGKRSVTLDFTDAEGKRKLWAILDDLQPDVLIHNYRHLDLARTIGVGPEQVGARYPGIVYTHLNAYGNHGGWKDRPGFEQVVQAVSGIQIGYARGARPKLLPSPIIDIGCGLLAAFGTLLGLYRRRRTGQGASVTTHLTTMAVLLQLPQVAASQRVACLERARRAGRPADFVVGRQVRAGILLARGEPVCVAGAQADLERWLVALRGPGLLDLAAALVGERLGRARGDEPPVLTGIGRALAAQPVDAWRRSLHAAGLAGRVALVTQAPIRRIVEDLGRWSRRPRPQVRRRAFPGAPQELAFVQSPIHLAATPLADVDPTPVRGTHTREVLARVGVDVPAGTGMVPYPADKPLWLWLLAFVRWGYFAWKSGNI